MLLEKHFKTIREPGQPKRREYVKAVREDFPIMLREPLTSTWLNLISKREGLLFQSTYGNCDPLSVSWGYKFVRRLNDKLPDSLKSELGLDQPFKDSVTGKEIADSIHLWQHWARSERAHSLREQYGFKEGALMSWFSWEDFVTAHRYSKAGSELLAKKMLRATTENDSV